VVGALADPVFEHFGRHFSDFAGRAAVSGAHWRYCVGGRRHGRNRQLGERRRPRILGVGLRLGNPPRDIRRHVRSSSATLLVPADDYFVVDNDNCRFCYPDVLRGGFGTMPAFTADYFGPKNVGPIYGLMLTAWSFASVFGPLYIARMRETAGNYAGALHVIAVVMLISVVLPIIVRPPRREQSA
jgi:MFS family permease